MDITDCNSQDSIISGTTGIQSQSHSPILPLRLLNKTWNFEINEQKSRDTCNVGDSPVIPVLSAALNKSDIFCSPSKKRRQETNQDSDNESCTSELILSEYKAQRKASVPETLSIKDQQEAQQAPTVITKYTSPDKDLYDSDETCLSNAHDLNTRLRIEKLNKCKYGEQKMNQPHSKSKSIQENCSTDTDHRFCSQQQDSQLEPIQITNTQQSNNEKISESQPEPSQLNNYQFNIDTDKQHEFSQTEGSQILFPDTQSSIASKDTEWKTGMDQDSQSILATNIANDGTKTFAIETCQLSGTSSSLSGDLRDLNNQEKAREQQNVAFEKIKRIHLRLEEKIKEYQETKLDNYKEKLRKGFSVVHNVLMNISENQKSEKIKITFDVKLSAKTKDQKEHLRNQMRDLSNRQRTLQELLMNQNELQKLMLWNNSSDDSTQGTQDKTKGSGASTSDYPHKQDLQHRNSGTQSSACLHTQGATHRNSDTVPTSVVSCISKNQTSWMKKTFSPVKIVKDKTPKQSTLSVLSNTVDLALDFPITEGNILNPNVERKQGIYKKKANTQDKISGSQTTFKSQSSQSLLSSEILKSTALPIELHSEIEETNVPPLNSQAELLEGHPIGSHSQSFESRPIKSYELEPFKSQPIKSNSQAEPFISLNSTQLSFTNGAQSSIPESSSKTQRSQQSKVKIKEIFSCSESQETTLPKCSMKQEDRYTAPVNVASCQTEERNASYNCDTAVNKTAKVTYKVRSQNVLKKPPEVRKSPPLFNVEMFGRKTFKSPPVLNSGPNKSVAFKSPEFTTETRVTSTVQKNISPSTVCSSDVFPVSCREIARRIQQRKDKQKEAELSQKEVAQSQREAEQSEMVKSDEEKGLRLSAIKLPAMLQRKYEKSKESYLNSIKLNQNSTTETVVMEDNGKHGGLKFPPLKMLIESNVLIPAENILSVIRPHHVYTASLMEDGWIKSQGRELFSTPLQWFKAVMGDPTLKKGQAYREILYDGRPLKSYVDGEEKADPTWIEARNSEHDLNNTQTFNKELYTNQSSVNTELYNNQSSVNTENEEHASQLDSHEKQLAEKLFQCNIHLIGDNELIPSDDLPENFWGDDFAEVHLSYGIWNQVNNWQTTGS